MDGNKLVPEFQLPDTGIEPRAPAPQVSSLTQ